MDPLLSQHFVAAVVFALVGVVFLAGGLLVMIRICPFSIRREIEEDQNTALAIIIAAIILGLSIIIAAAIHG
ncbi:MAG: DUF350 domain-containing protein [Planctomycetia bacterium]